MSEKGRIGEESAVLFLKNKGMKIISRNFRYRGGEVDIIALEGDNLVFIEVKTWVSYGIEALEYGIDEKKQHRIIETAKYFLAVHREYRYMTVRFDVIFISSHGITHLASAFVESV